ncbi:MAG: hypothetical protein OXR73_21995 [Myxococcales bacterium]|nr:hypothetical protein [Myxococcales bacterium]
MAGALKHELARVLDWRRLTELSLMCAFVAFVLRSIRHDVATPDKLAFEPVLFAALFLLAALGFSWDARATNSDGRPSTAYLLSRPHGRITVFWARCAGIAAQATALTACLIVVLLSAPHARWTSDRIGVHSYNRAAEAEAAGAHLHFESDHQRGCYRDWKRTGRASAPSCHNHTLLASYQIVPQWIAAAAIGWFGAFIIGLLIAKGELAAPTSGPRATVWRLADHGTTLLAASTLCLSVVAMPGIAGYGHLSTSPTRLFWFAFGSVVTLAGLCCVIACRRWLRGHCRT